MVTSSHLTLIFQRYISQVIAEVASRIFRQGSVASVPSPGYALQSESGEWPSIWAQWYSDGSRTHICKICLVDNDHQRYML